jgi:hypothetical protein
LRIAPPDEKSPAHHLRRDLSGTLLGDPETRNQLALRDARRRIDRAHDVSVFAPEIRKTVLREMLLQGVDTP